MYYTVNFTGFVDVETKLAIEKLLKDKGALQIQTFPKELSEYPVFDGLKSENLKNLSSFQKEVLKQKVEFACTNTSKLDIPQATSLIKYIEKYQ